ncbi:tetratricopeptide repeat protein [Solihabitans fulvus]|uniref:Tetratricopeptide repeat protein n=1 Tax=Solihabitans fulvus TaxID=1892852 RepID=A0A5B2XEP6_9PSEU|nr:BTAD domain-containing putative transcriptional regulator [Solihabitans fulvus]KAA2262207.1 tetratricopeptide repeat protein [Solihabitans fulvus]
MDSEVEFRVLGELAVLVGGHPVVVRAGRQRALLAALLLRAGVVVSVDELAERLWGDEPPARTRATLQTYVMRLRRTLGTTKAIRTVPDGYVIEVSPRSLDLLRFDRLLASGERELAAGALTAAATSFAGALAQWRGPALADVPSESLHRDEVPRLTERRLHALERRVEADLALGRHAELVPELRELTGEHPLRERFWAHLMLALYRCGRPADALTAYHRVDELLGELGIDPGERLRELYQRIRAGDGKLAAARDRDDWVVPSQLPADIADFVGRAETVAGLGGLLRAGDTPVVAVTGPPGVGKTALAVHAAHRLRASYPDGQLYVNLRGYAPGPPLSAVDALSRFLRALGIAPEAVPLDQRGQEELYRSTLRGRRVLVVLDNAATAEQLRPLLPGRSGCAVLVTSRDTLRDLGAGQVRLAMLTGEESRELLAGMLGDAQVGAEPSATDELAGLCAHLPLALRIAAANLASRPGTSVARYVRELRVGNRLAALTVDGDALAAVRAAFDLSYAALPAAPARLFRLLSLVPGPEVTAEAAAALGALPTAEAARLLDRLAAANLVDHHADGRYQLHDLLREYAAERSAAEEPGAGQELALTRLLEWYLRSVDNAVGAMSSSLLRLPRGPERAEVTPMTQATGVAAVAWLDAERANLVAAVLHAAERGPRRYAWHLADALRGYFYAQGLQVEWLAAAEAGLHAARQAGSGQGEGAMWSALGTLYWVLGRRRSAIAHYQRAVPLQREAGDEEAVAASLSNIGSVHIDLGELEQAVERLELSLEITRRIDAPERAAIALFNLGGVYLQLGQLGRAVRCFTDSLAAGTRLGSALSQANCERALGEAYAELGELTRAEQHHRRALALYRLAGARTFEHTVHEGLAIVHAAFGRYEEAIAEADEALRLTLAVDDPKAECDARNELGAALCAAGRPADAAGHHETALRIAERTSYPWGVCVSLRGLAAVWRAQGRVAEAVRTAERALAEVRGSGLRLAEAGALVTLGQAQLDAGNLAEAARCGDEGVRLAEATGQRVTRALALRLAGAARVAAGDDAPGRARLAAAAECLAGLGVSG